jgi:hypothetical protein
MHSQLENYLAAVETKLRSLPAEQRESDIVELRQHLESIMAAYKELGYSDDEAAMYAVQQFGAPKTVGSELRRSSLREDLRRAGTRICCAGWALFIVSYLVPVVQIFGVTVRGLQCALFVLTPSLPYTSSPWGTLYYHSLGLANVLMLVSPILLLRSSNKKHQWVVSGLLGLSAALISPLLFSSGWEIGFYAWFASFGLVAIGSLFRAKQFVRGAGPTSLVKVR